MSKFESAASDLPPEGLSQKRYVEIQDFCKNSELDLGTSKFESAASDLPPEGLFQRRYVEIQDFCNFYVKK